MKVGDKFKIMWGRNPTMCRINEINQYQNEATVHVTLYDAHTNEAADTYVFMSSLIKLKNECKTRWEVTPRSPRD